MCRRLKPAKVSICWSGLHPSGIARPIEQVTHGTFLVKPGSLFPALHRMEGAGWVSSEWGAADSGRRAKFYRLSRAGRRQLELTRYRVKEA